MGGGFRGARTDMSASPEPGQFNARTKLSALLWTAPAAPALWLAVNSHLWACIPIAPRKTKTVSRSACHRTPKASHPLAELSSFCSLL
jgi:hypothetical protein